MLVSMWPVLAIAACGGQLYTMARGDRTARGRWVVPWTSVVRMASSASVGSRLPWDDASCRPPDGYEEGEGVVQPLDACIQLNEEFARSRGRGRHQAHPAHLATRAHTPSCLMLDMHAVS
ncbi:hypothetical protein C8Q77DRAFT_128161 [Trametes polyzona]|nr:hypothetical protein C8Q77DRAFT_128161 [Trametes polyzona]